MLCPLIHINLYKVLVLCLKGNAVKFQNMKNRGDSIPNQRSGALSSWIMNEEWDLLACK